MGGKKKKKSATADAALDLPEACWICCEGAEPDQPLLQCGCACRGTAGLAHLSCLVAAAKHSVEAWTNCPTCKQEYTGEVDVGLARARWDLVRARPADDAERLFVANNLAVTLKESAGDNEGALGLMEEVLAVRRRTLGDEHPETIDSIINLALQHNEVGSYAAALPLAVEAVGAARRAHDDAHERTLVAISCLGAVHNSLHQYAEARPLHEEALAARRQLLGEGHLETMNSIHLLGRLADFDRSNQTSSLALPNGLHMLPPSRVIGRPIATHARQEHLWARRAGGRPGIA